MFNRKRKQQTVRGVTFNPSTLHFKLVGETVEGNSLWDVVNPRRPYRNYAEAEKRANEYLRLSPLLYYVEVWARTSEGLPSYVSSVWRDE